MNKYRPEISQEEFEAIEQYLLETLSFSEREDFEARMESDSVLRDEVILQKKLLMAVELGSYRKGFKESRPSKTVKMYTPTNKVWLVAAAFVGMVLFSFIGYLLLRETNSKTENDLYAAYFYPDPGLPVVMSSTQDYKFYDGMVSYKEGKYDEALEIWSKLPEWKLESDTLHYYQGAAMMSLDKFDDSASYLDLVIADTASEFQAKARWYRSLIHIRQNEFDQATELLEKLSPQPRADDLLEALKKSP